MNLPTIRVKERIDGCWYYYDAALTFSLAARLFPVGSRTETVARAQCDLPLAVADTHSTSEE